MSMEQDILLGNMYGQETRRKCGLETTNDWGKEELRELAELLKLIIKQ